MPEQGLVRAPKEYQLSLSTPSCAIEILASDLHAVELYGVIGGIRIPGEPFAAYGTLGAIRKREAE